MVLRTINETLSKTFRSLNVSTCFDILIVFQPHRETEAKEHGNAEYEDIPGGVQVNIL